MSETQTSFSNRNLYTNPLFIGLIFAVIKLLLHFIFNSNYGYFRDELYFLACGEHLAFGYPDHAPMVALMAKASRVLLGDSLFAIRFFPAVAGAFKIFLTAVLVKEFGGRAYAAFLACLCVLCAPVYLAIDNLLSMNSLEPVFWMLCVYFAVRATKGMSNEETHQTSFVSHRSINWLFFGLFAGLGLMNKHSMLFFGFAIVAGLLLTSARKVFLDKYFWLGGLIAALVFLPNIVWQIQNDFATFELLQNVQKTGKNVAVSPPTFIVQQILAVLPVSFPVWLAGLWFFLFDRNGRRFRFLGITYLVLLALMIFLKAKDYYLVPVYPMLFAAGAIWWENFFAGKRRKTRGENETSAFEEPENNDFQKSAEQKTESKSYGFLFLPLRVLLPVLIFGLALLVSPAVLPVLPVETLIDYQEKTGLKPPKAEVAHDSPLQQIFSDQFGWEELVEKTAGVYNSLAPEERAKAGILAGNYGEAGAIDFFGAKYNLPKAISGHQSYFLWGPREYTGEILILLGASKKEAEEYCESVEEKTEVNHPFSPSYEKYKILICRRTKKPLPEVWQSLKHWN